MKELSDASTLFNKERASRSHAKTGCKRFAIPAGPTYWIGVSEAQRPGGMEGLELQEKTEAGLERKA